MNKSTISSLHFLCSFHLSIIFCISICVIILYTKNNKRTKHSYLYTSIFVCFLESKTVKGQILFFQILGNSWVLLTQCSGLQSLGDQRNGFRRVKIRGYLAFTRFSSRCPKDTFNYPIPGPLDSFCAGKGWKKPRLLLFIFIYSHLSNLSSIHFHSIYLSHLSILCLPALTLIRLPRKHTCTKTLAHTITRTHLYNTQKGSKEKGIKRKKSEK